jgi:hypothetical protein
LAHSDIPAPPGYKYDQVAFALERDPEYTQGDSFQADLAEYARNHEGQLRLWSLVGRLDADGFLGSGKPGTMPLLFHQAPGLLRALEDPVNRGVWETLWAAVLRGDEEMAYGEWGAGHPDWLGPFQDAVRKIIGDERAPLEWRGRFAVGVFLLLSPVVLITRVGHPRRTRERKMMCITVTQEPHIYFLRISRDQGPPFCIRLNQWILAELVDMVSRLS